MRITEKKHKCRACDSERLRVVYDFGLQPLAGQFPILPNKKNLAEKFHLDLSQCDACGLLQVTNVPPVGLIFHDDYRYSSSTIYPLVQHFADYAKWICENFPINTKILEIGCNDGVFLSKLKDKGYACVGVDASDNVAEMAREKGLTVYTGYMCKELIEKECMVGQFDLVTCSNVFAHVDDIKSIVESVRLALKPNGEFLVEVHDADLLVKESQFDTVYHEHLTYFTKATLQNFLEMEGFKFVECFKLPMHGGSLRMRCKYGHSDRGMVEIGEELIDGVGIKNNIDRCADEIHAATKKNGKFDGFGAAGRAQMFVNFTETQDCFAQVFDDSPMRQNRYMIGTDIPIVKFGDPMSDSCLILAWNYADSISLRVKNRYREVLTLIPNKKIW